jgi:hypothetical protein
MILINIEIFIINKISFYYRNIAKKNISKERSFINEGIEKAITIDGMVFVEKHQKEYKELSEISKRTTYLSNYFLFLGKTIPWQLLTNLFPFFLLIINPVFIGINFITN